MAWNDLIGTQLGQYTISEELGRGGSSRVYRAHDANLGRDVAIKVIQNDSEDRVGFVRRFQRELQAVAQLDHPNIVPVYDQGETQDFVYLVMQCVNGGTFRQRLGTPLAAREAASAAWQMARALHHAHTHGIIHRDVKPSNMLVDSEDPNHLLLTDFGIAKLQGMRGLTRTGTTIGTPEYMSPEQAEGKDIDPRADIYSLGCVIYESLTGRPPFVGSTPVSVLYQQVHSRPPYLRGFNPQVPRDLVRVIEQALAKQPEERFGTADAFAEALAPFTVERIAAPDPDMVATELLDGRTAGPGGLQRDTLTGQYPVTGDLPLPIVAVDSSPAQVTGWEGLGTEGLDAIFPHDPEAQAHAQQERASGPSPTTPAAQHTIPLPQFKLPAKRTRPLNLPMTSSGEVDVDALIKEADEGQRQPSLSPRSLRAPYRENVILPPLEAADTIGELRAVRDGVVTEAGDAADLSGQDDGAEDGGSLAGSYVREQGEREDLVTSLRRVVTESARARPVRPRLNGSIRTMSGRRRLLWSSAAAAALLVVAVAIWVGVSASALGITLPKHSTQATPTATVAPAPTATSTATSVPTATTTTQQALNQEAAAAFRVVTLSHFQDHGCSSANASRQFTPGQTLYINVCTASGALPGPMSILLRQNGSVVSVVVRNVTLSPGQGYSFYWYGLSDGTFDAQVTLTIGGQTATARDLPFTVS